MRRLLYSAIVMALSLAAFTSCSKKESVPKVAGDWNIISVTTKSASIGSQAVDVYLSFAADGSFTSYQKTGSSARYVRYSGTWQLTSGVLSGEYADGSPWACSYSVSVEGETMTLTSSSSPAEVSVYKRAEIPDSVIAEAGNP